MTFEEWSARHPQAAQELGAVFSPMEGLSPPPDGNNEAWAQQQIRFSVAQQGAYSWRNNCGALPDKRGVPVRYGLANDSAKVNAKLKSSDLILAIPRTIARADVGTTIAQFGSIEAKAPGWRYAGTKREQAQQNWLTLIRRLGGFATFSTGAVEL